MAQVVGCQPATSDVMARSVAAGTIQPELGGDGDGTLSDATAGGVEYGSMTLQPCIDCVDEWLTVSEVEIAEALVGLLEEHSKLVEGEHAAGGELRVREGSRQLGWEQPEMRRKCPKPATDRHITTSKKRWKRCACSLEVKVGAVVHPRRGSCRVHRRG